jgi:hypothetical protein
MERTVIPFVRTDRAGSHCSFAAGAGRIRSYSCSFNFNVIVRSLATVQEIFSSYTVYETYGLMVQPPTLVLICARQTEVFGSLY